MTMINMFLDIIESRNRTEPKEKFPFFAAETLMELRRPETICLLVCEIEIGGAAKARIFDSKDNSQLQQNGNFNIL